ncbi:MAG: prepilin-type N-terminal cleavage/methylation domain-containing protein [Planctomycetes bacterium]|nr:prepilin-type N-terminal cleavage/methylation domain-containing protein [Planctomycetota bacterium]
MNDRADRFRAQAGAAGFTLIELLGVIVILGILFAFLVPILGKSEDTARIMTAKARLEELRSAIAEYETKMGDYPSSSWKDEWGSPPNTTNIGAEALVIQLFGTQWQTTLSEDLLSNTDSDESRKALARFPKASLFEIKDPWGNPIAYSHRRDYEHPQVYLLQDPHTDELGESTFKAHKNEKTGEYWMPKKFQLVSAGPDAEFGTDDDITAWDER